MNHPTELEDRLRRGLRAAADALPPADAHVRTDRQPTRTRRWPVAAAAVAATVAVVVAAVTLVGRGDDRDGELETSPAQEPTTEQPPTTTEPRDPQPTNGAVPGQAVIVGQEVRTYGPGGEQTGTVDLAPWEAGAASSDLAGGWVICGDDTSAPPPQVLDEPQQIVPADDWAAVAEATAEMTAEEAAALEEQLEELPMTTGLVWFPADGEPLPLESASPWCMADAVRVVDSPDGPTAVYVSMRDMVPSLRAVVLATGEDRGVPLPIADPGRMYRWSASAGRVIVADVDQRPAGSGVQLFDLTTGESLPIAPIDPASASDIALSPDATSLALLTGEVDGPSDLVIYDLASGAETYRETFPELATEGAQLSYDGTTVAVGNFHEGIDLPYPPVTVIDLASGARHTIDVHGLVL